MQAWLTGVLIPLFLSGQAAQQSAIDITGYDENVMTSVEGDITAAILCDPGTFRLSIRAADGDSLDRSYPRRATVAAEALIQPLPNHGGDMQYRGALTRYFQCGPYSIRLTGGFYNANVEGQLGAYPAFPIVQVFADNRMIAPNDRRQGIAIGACERDNRLAPECPGDWAVRIDIAYDARREKVAVVEQALSTRHLGDDPSVGRQRSERRYEADNALLLWRKRP
ncbi:hypothetical protein FHR20_001087 [Sphingomonas leidyi]|uniref:Uncharacterized protein n=1 Tax=Sphingomonas leidyi TaxID=68569 RepID=A0A7X5UYQ7_9SPHN|nr:hypothetical protein [Sphingomonas leidyi]NIJ64156.1 hypothetical protein [Sphingomonas leidyi]